ncbi:helix-turn-helix domain-containing protein [Amphiplicatus metriothermophilus]|uniref:DnaA protein helix-turn-helix n=1 Tax=Amphiplicatus metriothermophilus TaxID=1519374 RepID=A0A239PZW4_9PROT|nr:helix-turn-helix domain-containing protein [Amphiplicatus metriothermophilus]MBB5518258.1 hypothetical protein [Amphiplicatus metriothermophilus]SNT75482.1 dnaA protein helix-turn-helix [Amphiplicatus metriothermophilus]
MKQTFRPQEGGASELSRLIARDAMEIAAVACSVRLDDLLARCRNRANVSFARQIAMYLCHVVGQMPMGEISHAFERDRTTVSYACHTIEDRRDSPIFDRQLELLEAEMRRRIAVIYARCDTPGCFSPQRRRLARRGRARRRRQEGAPEAAIVFPLRSR